MNAAQGIRIFAMIFSVGAGVMAFLISDRMDLSMRVILAIAPMAQTFLKIYFHVKRGKVSFRGLLSKRDNSTEILCPPAK